MSRYHKKIIPDADGLIDLYAIAEAFGVKSNPQFHAMKKIMMAGERGHKSLVQDIDEAIQASQRWKEMAQAELVAPRDEESARRDLLNALQSDIIICNNCKQRHVGRTLGDICVHCGKVLQ